MASWFWNSRLSKLTPANVVLVLRLSWDSTFHVKTKEKKNNIIVRCAVLLSRYNRSLLSWRDITQKIPLLKTPPRVHRHQDGRQKVYPHPHSLQRTGPAEAFSRGTRRMPQRLLFKTCLGGHCERFHTFYWFFLLLFLYGELRKRKSCDAWPECCIIPAGTKWL